MSNRTIQDNSGKILLFKGTGIVSRLVEFQTRSEYSHAALLYPGNSVVIESMQGAGVRTRPITASELYNGTVDVFDVPILNSWHWAQVFTFCEGELGAGYDYRSIVRFLTRTNAGSDTRWFCSELLFAAFESVGVSLLARTKAWKVSPGQLALSPLLVEANVNEQ